MNALCVNTCQGVNPRWNDRVCLQRDGGAGPVLQRVWLDSRLQPGCAVAWPVLTLRCQSAACDACCPPQLCAAETAACRRRPARAQGIWRHTTHFQACGTFKPVVLSAGHGKTVLSSLWYYCPCCYEMRLLHEVQAVSQSPLYASPLADIAPETSNRSAPSHDGSTAGTIQSSPDLHLTQADEKPEPTYLATTDILSGLSASFCPSIFSCADGEAIRTLK